MLNHLAYGRRTDVVINTRLEEFRGMVLTNAVTHYLRDNGDKSPMDIGEATFSPIEDSSLAMITCEHSDPERAAVSANAYAAVAEQIASSKNKEESHKAVAWLNDQAVNQREALEEAADLRIKFMVNNQMDLLEHSRKAAQDKLAQLSSSLVEIQSSMVLAQDLCDALDKIGDNLDDMNTLPTSTPRSAEIHEKLFELREAEAASKALRSKYREMHPKAIEAERTVAALASEALGAIKGASETAHTDLRLQLKQIESLESEISAQREIAARFDLELVQMKSKQDSMLRTEQALETTYSGLLRRIEEARLSADENTTSVSVAKKAPVPLVPLSPRPKSMMIKGLLLGLVLGAGLVFLKEVLDDPITSSADVEDCVDLHVLALIPRIRKQSRAHIARETLINRSGLIAESFAGMRVRLASIQYGSTLNSLLISSTAPGDGKTVVSSNIAITYARHGAKTLLIDFDLRRPKLRHVFTEIGDVKNLAEVLLDESVGASEFEALAQQSDCKNLDVIATHAVDDDVSAAEIVGSDNARRLLNWAKENYDQVILDSPPHGHISDAGVLASQVSGVVLVCWADRSRKHSLRHAVQQLSEVGANIVGVAINSVRQDATSGFGRYDYYHREYDSTRYV
ncbi:MAG: polysaccharide biosynthesis tyrosine autokinase [Verrucomicrobia bacterium]|nr:polysaccharide biosynthesis tyrosine autokinase [Verrucomicrobiota bacterium]